MQGRAWRLSIGQSPKTLQVLLVLHFIVAGLIWLAPLLWLWQIVLTLLLLVSSVFYYRKHTRRSDLVTIEHDASGQWRLHYSDHKSSWMVLSAAFCASFGVILYFKRNLFSSRAVFIANDAIVEGDLRILRICVRDARTYQQQ